MRCPDCDFDEMEAEDQSHRDFGVLSSREGKVRTTVHVRYFCPNCKEYWHWTRGHGGLKRDGG